MSLSRQFFREFRPFFRLLEEPFGRPPVSSSFYPRNSSLFPQDHPSNAPALGFSFPNVPAIDLSEEPNAFVVEAEIPGVKKENLDVRIGDGGQSLTIEGRTFVKSVEGPSANGDAAAAATEGGEVSQTQATEGTNAVVKSNDDKSLSTQLTSERTFTSSSSFSRTIWLPKRVDGSGVSAKLSDGILTIRVPKAEDKESVKINVE